MAVRPSECPIYTKSAGSTPYEKKSGRKHSREYEKANYVLILVAPMENALPLSRLTVKESPKNTSNKGVQP
jgi:hypothetical protein